MQLQKNITLPITPITEDLSYEMVNTKVEYKPTRSNTVISLVNATAATLPFADNCVDRIVALESALHFKSLSQFFKESKSSKSWRITYSWNSNYRLKLITSSFEATFKTWNPLFYLEI